MAKTGFSLAVVVVTTLTVGGCTTRRGGGDDGDATSAVVDVKAVDDGVTQGLDVQEVDDIDVAFEDAADDVPPTGDQDAAVDDVFEDVSPELLPTADAVDAPETSPLDGGGDTLQLPSCGNVIQDPGETDVDCGGVCKPCANTKFCEEHDDCLSKTCIFGICESPSCEDQLQNAEESDVDCGGTKCGPCADGLACLVGGDCDSGRCSLNTCVSCQDGVENGLESAVDCGGPCEPCADGLGCVTTADCASGICTDLFCTSCDDELRNGDETDIDCGGAVCDACALGSDCLDSGDCATGICQDGTCCLPNACGVCGALPLDTCNGVDDDCDGATDEDALLQSPPPCPKQAGACVGAVAVCLGGWSCTDATYSVWSDEYQAVEADCDEIDNDCDGLTDEQVENACGTCGALPPDLCDGVDGDCDGQTDEDTSLVGAPPCSGAGVCKAAVPTCLGAAGVGCSYAAIGGWQANETLCDGLDNDCDGKTDETAACTACNFPTIRTVFAGGEYTSYERSTLAAFRAPLDDLYVAVSPSGFDDVDYGLIVARLSYGSVVDEATLPEATFPIGTKPSIAVGADGVWLARTVDSKLHVVLLDFDLGNPVSFTGPTSTRAPVLFPDGRVAIGDPDKASLGSFDGGTWVSQAQLSTWGPNLSFVNLEFDPGYVAEAPYRVVVRATLKLEDGSSTGVLGLWRPDQAVTHTLAVGGSLRVSGLHPLPSGATGILYRVSVGGVFSQHYVTQSSSGVLSTPEKVVDSSFAQLLLVDGVPHVFYLTALNSIGLSVRGPDGTWSSTPYWDPPGSALEFFWVGLDSGGRVHLLYRAGFGTDLNAIMFCD